MQKKYWVLIFVLLALIPLARADLFGKGMNTQRVTTALSPARADHMSSMGGGARRINFQFGQMRAWLNENGDWQIYGQIEHTPLICAVYEVGMRFGEGKGGGCTDVNWLSEVQYVTRERQCNGATARHEGGEYQHYISKDFDRVTCAERVIRCQGKCK
jgi:hypothetical protein